MGDGSLKAEFRFLSYKIDHIKLSILHNTNVLQFDCNYENCTWDQSISIRNPVYFTSSKVYLCGVNSTLKLKHQKEKSKRKEIWLKLQIGIVGLFAIDDRMGDDLEKKFVTIGAPAILFPFMRAACTNVLASSGFGSVVMPLINMHKVGKAFALKPDFNIAIKE